MLNVSRIWWHYFNMVMLLGLTVFAVFGVYWLATEESPDRGGVYVEAEVGAPRAMNPLLAHFNDVDKDLAELVFGGLTKLGSNGQVMPSLSDRWSISSDNLTYTFHISDRARWQDGNPVTPEDILYTIGVVHSKAFPGSPDLAAFWKDIQVEKVDSETLKFKLPRPFSPFLSYTNLGLLPSHLLKDKTVEELAQDKFNVFPVGAGRFAVESAKPDAVTLNASSSSMGPRPLLDQVKLLFFADQYAAVAAVKSGKADAILLSSDAPSESANVLAREAGLTEHREIRTNYTALFFNSQSPLFQDARVRKAIVRAIDRNALVKIVLKGNGQLSDSPIVPNTWANSGSNQAQIIPADQNQAAALLTDAGWTLGSNGVRNKDGVEFQFAISTNDNPVRSALATAISTQLQPLGIKVASSTEGAASLLRSSVIPRRFDALLYGMDMGYDPDSYAVWHSSQDKEDGLNISSFSDPQIDSLLAQARDTTDVEKRKELYRKFQDLFVDQAPAVVLYYPVYTYWVNSKLKGLETSVLFEPSSRFLNIEGWYFKTKRALRSSR
ncbi:MAG: hypothetical protein EXR50_06255 [Dehalococcoidia bacterium]|nr:hypothetical protein [Dehalococcoidia bacterium]